MDREAWWATVHGVAKSWTRLSNFTFTFVCVCVCVCKTILQVNVAGNIQSQDSKADCLGLNWVPSLTSCVTPDSLLSLSVS